MTRERGSRLGAYEVIGPLGAGGMGEVYRARDSRLDRDVALKVLPARLSEDPAALARFEREAKAVAALSHPGILAIFEFGTAGGVAYAVTELLEGETLRERLAEGALPARKAIEYAVQMAEGLAAAHERGIVHRDLKPENVFVTKDDRVKILDFGLARQAVVTADDTSSPTLSRHTDPGTSWEPSATCRRSRCADSPRAPLPTSSRSASSSTRCSRGDGPSRAARRRRQ